MQLIKGRFPDKYSTSISEWRWGQFWTFPLETIFLPVTSLREIEVLAPFPLFVLILLLLTSFAICDMGNFSSKSSYSIWNGLLSVILKKPLHLSENLWSLFFVLAELKSTLKIGDYHILFPHTCWMVKFFTLFSSPFHSLHWVER